uniref:RING finger protein 207 n=1 Tax=Strigamia maritima TaxID=126957 RepID=T1JLK1_STRMM
MLMLCLAAYYCLSLETTITEIMSGGILPQSDNQENNFTRSPLLCYLCNELLKDPCLLQCYHTFCSECLNGKSNESKLMCPFCGKNTILKDSSSLPPTDPLLSFLIESSVEEWPPCSNCDTLHSPHDSVSMFYCNTCEQAVCGNCREDTHKARMFNKHDIIHMSKRTKDVYKTCDQHGKPYIMFSTLNKSMLCINCFRDMGVDGRAHCIDLESAYNEECKKLDSAVVSIRDLQSSVRDGITLFCSLLDELSHNAESEKESIHKLCQNLQDIIISTRHCLLDNIQRQYDVKQQLFCKQLDNLKALLPTIQVHLIICTTFSSSANKYEFLHYGYTLMDRLNSIAHMSSPLRPTRSSGIKTNFKNELSKNLNPLISEKLVHDMGKEAKNCFTVFSQDAAPSSSCYLGKITIQPTTNTYINKKHGIINKKLKPVDVSGWFTEHCKNFDADRRELEIRFTKIKDQVQELQRDVTLRKCITRKEKVIDIEIECTALKTDITKQSEALENLKFVLEKSWEEQLQRIAVEQDIYNTQNNDLEILLSDTKCLATVTRRLEPFIKSITAIVEKISPRLRRSLHKDEKNECIQALFDQINTLQPDSQQRVEAILSQEEQKLNKFCGPSPFEESLIQTKGMLKTPMKDGIPIRKDTDGTPLKNGTVSSVGNYYGKG